MRPKSLQKVALLTAGGDSFDRCLANFLAGFYASPTAAALAEAPRMLGTELGDEGRGQDAYLAATAEELARRFYSCFDHPSPFRKKSAERILRKSAAKQTMPFLKDLNRPGRPALPASRA